MKLNLVKTYILFMAFLLSCAGCGCDVTEIFRETSQDNKIDVVIVEGACGVTVSDWVKVYLVDKGSSISKKRPVLYASRLKEVHVKWLNPKLLEITYEHANIHHFKNFWFFGDNSEPWDKVRILEIQKETPVENSW